MLLSFSLYLSLTYHFRKASLPRGAACRSGPTIPVLLNQPCNEDNNNQPMFYYPVKCLLFMAAVKWGNQLHSATNIGPT